MGFKDILGKITRRDDQKDETFLSLSLTPDKVLASIWTFDQNSVQILGFSKKSYQSLQGIVHQAAVAIDSAAEKAGSDVSKAVFGLSANWFKEKEPTKDTAKLLKKLSEDLDLSAQAYVPFSASIKNYLKIKNSTSYSGVLIGIFDKFLEAHLVQDNKIIETKTAMVQPTTEKIASILTELKEIQDLPLSIVIFGISDDSKIAQDLTRADFKGIFHDLPKIEFLKDSEIAKSVAFAQAADILGHEPSLTLATPVTEGTVKDSGKNHSKANELGFIEGEDILKSQATDVHKEVEQIKTKEEAEEKKELAVEHEPNKEQIQNVEPTAVDKVYPSREKGNFIENIVTLNWFAKIQNIFRGPGISLRLAKGLLALLIVVVIGLFIGGKTQTSAEVVIKVKTNSNEDTFDVDVKKGASNFSRDQIAGEQISATADDSSKTVTTGIKKVGEPARGEVTVFNWTTAEKSFSKGTVIISKNGIQFEINDEVKVASRSASTPGEKKTGITAIDRGPDGNLSGGNDFTFQQYDELLYSASNEAAFTGGDEKEVTVVSQQDLDKLLESLQESLEKMAVASLKEKAAGKNVLEDAIDTEIVKQVFDKDLEEEAALVNLDLEIEASVLAYEESELKKYLAETSNDDAPQNLEAKSENIDVLSLDAKNLKGTLNLTGKFKVNFVPKLNDNDLKDKILGKSVKDAREIIKSVPEVLDVEVKFTPPFFITNTLPSNKDKISFKVES